MRIKVELVGGGGIVCDQPPGRVFIVGPGHTFEQLAATARTVDPVRMQAVIREFRQSALEQPEQVLKLLPAIWRDTLIITVALATIAIEDLGGAAWLEDISPGLTQAEARHQAPVPE